MGKLVYIVTTSPGEEGKVGTTVLTAFDAASGEVVWKKTFSNRRFTPPAYRGPNLAPRPTRGLPSTARAT